MVKLEAGAESNGVPEKQKLGRFVTAAVTSDEELVTASPRHLS